MSEFQLLAIGALFGLGTGIIIQLVTHFFSNRRDANNWKRDELRREKESHERKIEKLEAESTKIRSEKDELQGEMDKRQRDTLAILIYAITLMNQRRDHLLGFDQDEQLRRAAQIKEMLSKLSEEELTAIANEEIPLPELPGKPKSLSS